MECSTFLAFLLSFVLPAAGAEEGAEGAGEPATVLVGVAKVDITPEAPVRMYGYASRKTESEGVAGHLYATALAIGGDAGEGPAVLLTVDSGAVPAEIRSDVLAKLQVRAKIREERFVLANAHSHSGPNLKGMASFRGAEREHMERYASQLTERLEKVVSEALDSRRSGRLSWAVGEVGFAANRRVLKEGRWVGFGAVPEAPVDHSLPVLRVTDDEGKLLAVLVNYACHPTTLRGDFRKIHGDWVACAQEMIESDHPGARAMVTIGCGADADPHPHGTVELAVRHGRALADEVKRLLGGAFVPISPALKARREVLEIPRTGPLAGGGESSAVAEYPITSWVFGRDLALVFLTGEVVVDYARRLKKELDGQRLWLTAYANDVPCYIVSKRLLGEGGYEVRSSLSSKLTGGRPEEVQPAMEDRIIAAVRRLVPADFHSKSGPQISEPILFHTAEADAILRELEVFPPDNPWNTEVSAWPLHPQSEQIIASIGADKPLRYNPDMAFILVPPEQPRVNVEIVAYPGESDRGPFPVPDRLPIEGWPVGYQRETTAPGLTLDDLQRDRLERGGDRHGIVVDPVNRMLYEFFQVRKTDGGWQAAQASVFDLKTNALRPAGWTSADAAGLPIFPAVVRFDELARGRIEHALRVTVRKTRRAYVAPATHFASRHESEEYPRMGERIRLRRDFDVSGFSREVQTILNGLKTYGMFVADNGIEWAVSVAPDPRIPNLHQELRRVRGSAFEVVVAPE